MTTNSDQPAQQTDSGSKRHEPLLEWYDDQTVQERIAYLIAKAATTTPKVAAEQVAAERGAAAQRRTGHEDHASQRFLRR